MCQVFHKVWKMQGQETEERVMYRKLPIGQIGQTFHVSFFTFILHNRSMSDFFQPTDTL